MKSLSFFKGLSWLIILNLLVKPVWIFFIDREVQNITGHEAYGEYFAILNLSFVLYFISDAGLSNMLNQRMAANKGSVQIKQLIGFKVFLLALFAITTLFVAWLTNISQWEILFYVIIIQSLNSLLIFLRNMITAHQHFQADAWLSVTDKFLMIVFCGVLIYSSAFGQINILKFLQVQIICSALAVLIASVYISRKHWFVVAGRENFNAVLKTIAPFAIAILLMSVHTRLDGFLLERIHINGAFEAGIYATAFRLLDASNMVGYLAASFLVPFISKNKNDSVLVSNVLIGIRHGLLLLAIGIVAFAWFFAPWILQLLYGSSDPYNVSIIQLCLSALPAIFLVHIYGSALTATARFNVFLPILIVSVIINLVLNALLIPGYGAEGCCISSIASQYFCGISCYIASVRTISVGAGLKSAWIYLLFAAILSALFYFGSMAISNVWVILAIAILIVLIILATQIRSIKKYFVSHH